MREPAAVRLRQRVLIWLLLATATLAAHGWSLGDGLWLDDHWHQARLRDTGWSVSELLEFTTIEPSRFIHAWWQDQTVRWVYARPVSVLVLKVVDILTGGSVVGHHAMSLLLHWLSACMVYQLGLKMTRNQFWSGVGGLLFVVYSHALFAVSWIAPQNTVLQTTLMLAALLFYIRASGLNVYAAPAADRRSLSEARSDQSSALNLPAFTACLFFWLAALFSRENAIMFPVIAVSCDLAFGGWRHVRARTSVYLVLGTLTTAFLIWRLFFFYHPIPDLYMRRPGSDGYALWWLAKLAHYLCSSVWLSPMTVGPTGRFHPFQEVPGDCVLMLAILAVMGTAYYQACRRARGYWIWPLWLILAILPVVPVLATPHSGYLSGVGFAIAMILGPGLYRSIHPIGLGRFCRPVAAWFLIATCTYLPIYRTLWKGMVAAERFTVAGAALDPPPDEVTDVFFLNLPFVNIYAPLHVAESWGDRASALQYHVLTFAPQLMRMEQSCRLTQHDPYTFSLSVDGRPYFSGLLGRFLIEGMRQGEPLRAGQVIPGDLFDVRVARAEPDGIRELTFTFHEALASDRFRFYLTSEEYGALRVELGKMDRSTDRAEVAVDSTSHRQHNVADAEDRLLSGEAAAAEDLFVVLGTADEAVRLAAWDGFRRVAGPVARATGSGLEAVVGLERPPADWSAIREWWRGIVDDRVLDRVWVRRDDSAALRRTRDALFFVRSTAARVIRTDLYLTGPPFPGPRRFIEDREPPPQTPVTATATAAAAE